MESITVKNLTKKFGDLVAVNNVSFSVPKGSVFAFLGPNGAGKTTTIKILTTLLSKTSGEVTLEGFSLEGHAGDVRKHFGIVFQDPSLDDDLTAYENMEFHGMLYGMDKEVRNRRIDELLTLVELLDRKEDLVRTFSGGMKRRLEIARALLHAPKLIFLDEPTVGLDPQTRNKIWEYILNQNEAEGVTVFITTHYIEEAEKMANRVAIIDHGKIIAEGTPAELREKTGTPNLEEAFLKLTGTSIRVESGGNESFRSHARAWGRR